VKKDWVAPQILRLISDTAFTLEKEDPSRREQLLAKNGAECAASRTTERKGHRQWRYMGSLGNQIHLESQEKGEGQAEDRIPANRLSSRAGIKSLIFLRGRRVIGKKTEGLRAPAGRAKAPPGGRTQADSAESGVPSDRVSSH